jgi:hypothetical protein
MIDFQASAEATRQRTEQTAQRLEENARLLLRSSFPLEPVELFFTIEYSMDQAQLKNYAERLQSDIVIYLRAAREGRRPTSDDLAGEDVEFVISNEPGWQPANTDTERAAYSLLQDNTSFVFNDPTLPDEQQLRFLSTSPSIQESIVTMTRHGDLSQRVSLTADFGRRVFMKSVWCINPVRTGSDLAASSALDLIGRTLTWRASPDSDLEWTLFGFEMRFSYDYGFGQLGGTSAPGRSIHVSGRRSVEVTGDHVGLTDVLNRT